MANVVSSQAVVIGGALVIPQGLLAQRKGETIFCVDADARKRIEQIAMHAVIDAETRLVHSVKHVSHEAAAHNPRQTNRSMTYRSKGRAQGQTTITVSRNEIIYGLNQTNQFTLAIVLVDGDSYQGPYYLKNPFNQEPDFGVASINYDLEELLSRATCEQFPLDIFA